MSDDPDSPAYVRAHRAKRRMEAVGRIDWGAIAAGDAAVVVCMAVFVIFPLGPWLAAALFGIGVLLGGYLATHLNEGMSASVAGVLVGTTSTMLLVVVGLSAAVADTEDVALTTAFFAMSPVRQAAGALAALGLAVIGALLARGRNG